MRRALAPVLVGVVTAATALGASSLAPAAGAATPAATAAPVAFTTPGTTTWTVPAGVHRIEVVAVGAKGGDSPASSFFHANGGAGAQVRAVVDVTPGQQLQVDVAVGGGTSQWGGAGGGAADVRVAPYALTNRVVVGAGGGGAGADSSQCGVPGAGGAAGGGNGGDGPAQHQECSPGGTGGAGASANAPGVGGDAFYVTTHHSGDGGFGTGGVASGDDPTDAVGGGGGGGWYGGGAGGGLFQSFAGSGGGGGAGSNHVGAPAHDAVIADGAGTAGASVTITPAVDATSVSITTAYTAPQEVLVRVLAFLSRRSESVAQRDATLRLVQLLDHRAGASTTGASRSAAWARGTVKITSTYTASQAAAVERVARGLHLTSSMLQRLAVTLSVFLLVIHR
ncbi:MAG TPA: hypothetical protein VIB48_10565 [Acidimicrobiia bacterium]